MSWPHGYGLAAAGVVIFGLGGGGDMLWHVVFGVEVGIDALLSPTHLVLLAGGALVLSTGLRAGWTRPVGPFGPTLRAELPAVLSLTLVTALGAFFLLYASVFSRPAVWSAPTPVPEGAPGHDAAEAGTALGLASYLVTTLLLVAPLLLAERTARRPRGAAFVLIAAVSWLSVSVAGFTRYGTVTAVAVTVAALALEPLLALVSRSSWSSSLRLSVLAATVPALLWSGQLLALALVAGLAWPPELWAGVVGLTVLAAAALGAVVGWARETPELLRPQTSVAPAR